MAASYPGSLPTLITAGTYLDSNPHDVLHDATYDEIVAIATELGTDPAGSATNVSTRLSNIELDSKTTWADASHVITQGVTITNNTAATLTRYNELPSSSGGKLVYVEFKMVGSSAGTAGSTMTIKMPHTFITNSLNGWGIWYDQTGITTRPVCYFVEASSNTAQAITKDSGASALGVAPAYTWASGDYFEGVIWYEIS
jgi:hypothetical protein